MEIPEPYVHHLWNHESLTKQAYLTFIHQVEHSKRSAQLFENNIVEICTYSQWYLVPMLWCPIAVWYLIDSSCTFVWKLIGLWTGLVIWIPLEYVTHRFLFHLENCALLEYRVVMVLDFLLHSYHHKYPQDINRLVMPVPLAWCLLQVISLFVHLCIYVLFHVRQFFVKMLCDFIHVDYQNLNTHHNIHNTNNDNHNNDNNIHNAVLAGIIVAYCVYDMSHYVSHVSCKPMMYPPFKNWMKVRRMYHSYHHYRDVTKHFGVTNTWIDRIFGTNCSSCEQCTS